MTDDDEDSIFKSIPEHGTNILPLRWIGNFFNLYPGSFALHRALRQEDKASYYNTPLSKSGYFWWRMYSLFDIPYKKWGTVYRMEWKNEDKD